MSRLDDLRMVDPVLTTVAQAYVNNAMVGEFLFPSVSVSKLKGKIPVFGKEAFIARDMSRAIRAQSNRIPPADLTFADFETRERDIEIALDYIEEEESAGFYRLEQRVARELMDILMLDKEIEAAALAQDPDGYDTSLKEEITLANAWDDYTNEIDPIAIIKDGMESVRSRIARYPNTMIIGSASYRALVDNPVVIDRIKYSSIANGSLSLISELTGIKSIHVGMAVKTTDGTSFTDIWSDNVILAYVDASEKSGRSEFNPSYGYTFQREGKPEIDTYYENGGKIKVIRNTDNYCIKVTSPDAAFLIYDTNHLS